MKLTSLVLAAGLSLVCVGGFAADVNLNAQGRTAADVKRDITAKPDQVIAFSGIKKGMKVLDILGGGGYYSELLSQVVGKKGKVYLHNNQAYLKFVGKELTARMKDNRLANVVDYKAEADKLGFDDNSLDAVFFVLGYHDLYHKTEGWDIDPKSFLTQLKRALKPGGILVVIDHAAPDGSNTQHSQKNHRIDELYVKKELSDMGFKFVKASQMLRNADDNRLISPFRPEVRRKTDRFVMLFNK